MKYRNTLLSTTLLYDVVIGSQGIDALGWQNKMNTDPVYASFFKLLYDTFSGIKLKVFRDGKWKNEGKFRDAGPLNWKFIGAEIPSHGEDTIMVRLEFIPDNFMIDYLAYETSDGSEQPIFIKTVEPEDIYDKKGTLRNDIKDYINTSDESYLVTEPGDVYDISFNIGKSNGINRTALIRSAGYYVEWLRGNWIAEKDSKQKFNLYDLRGTLSRLADRWIENSGVLEEEFFRSRAGGN